MIACCALPDVRWCQGSSGDAGSCERPGRIYCHSCRTWSGVRCNTGSRAKCGPCSELKRGDVASVARSGFLGHPAALLWFVTFTAPGAKLLGWDRSKCSHGAGVRCSGDVGCVVDAVALAAWHSGLPKRWSYFRQWMQRELPGCDVQYVKTWEAQKRGALHCHAMVRVTGIASAKRIDATLRRFAGVHGFGTRTDVQQINALNIQQVARTAGYVAKYISKGYDDLRGVAVLNSAGDVVRKGLRPWSASREWGDTMAVCRDRRQAYATSGGATANATQLAACVAAHPGGAAALDLYSDSSTTCHFATLPTMPKRTDGEMMPI